MSTVSASMHETPHGCEIAIRLGGREIERLTLHEAEQLIAEIRSLTTQGRMVQAARMRLKTVPMGSR